VHRIVKNTLSYVAAFVENLRAQKPRARLFAAFVFGSVSALAYAPVNLFPVFWICFPALIFLLQGTSSAGQAFLTGWSFAFGAFLFSLYWIAAAMFVDIAHFWWAVPLAVAGLPFFLALYYGVAAVLARKIGLRGISGAITFALLWFLADYVRGHLFTGFPWNLEGYGWNVVLPILQITSVTGIYGLTLLMLIAVSLPACLAENKKSHRIAFLGSLVCLALIFVWGETRLTQVDATVPGVRLRIVQPNTDQAHKWIEGELESHFHYLLDLSSAPPAQASDKPVTHIIWPETAATFYLIEDAKHRRAVAAEVPASGAIVTGVIRRSAGADNQLHYYNSLIAVDRQANIVADYDKFHLVPFGEYIPLRKIFPLRTLANLGLDFSSGDGPHTLRVPNLPSFSPFVCYEAIFPGAVTDHADRPQFLLNVTNDGWYGHTSGPYQHFAAAKVRAIEEGLPLVRAANTGISGVVDSYGRVVARLGVGRSGFVDADLPQSVRTSVFSVYGDDILWILFVLATMSAVYFRKYVENHRK